ncbi:MAG: C40 family peptidase [Bacteroidales bacterium]|nr:C40 family peptidase [Bacteroidales bacterium]MBQ4197911.1 C40 family peptidase [Bacteroidales bacterium]
MKKIYLLLSAALLLNIGAFGQNVNALFNKISNDVMNKYAPDERDKTYDVSLIEKDGKLILVGSTTEKEAVEALVSRLADAGITAQNRIDLLPSNSLKGKTYGIVCMSTASFNCDGRFSGESGTQALMGMPVRILEENDDDWYRCINMEGYTAWVITRSVKAMTKAEYEEYLAKPKVFVNKKYSTLYSEKNVSSLPVSDLVWGCILIDEGRQGVWRKVSVADGRTGYVPEEDVIDLHKWMDNAVPTEKNIVETAKQFCGFPYVWGGTSIKGVDCSGLTKSAYFLNGYVLRRDASQQCKTGDSVDVHKFVEGTYTKAALANLRPGDLLFFGRKAENGRKERVTHVAIYMGDGKIIHSSNIVRINSLIPGEKDYYAGAKRLLKARRIIGTADQGKGVVSVKNAGLTK